MALAMLKAISLSSPSGLAGASQKPVMPHIYVQSLNIRGGWSLGIILEIQSDWLRLAKSAFLPDSCLESCEPDRLGRQSGLARSGTWAGVLQRVLPVGLGATVRYGHRAIFQNDFKQKVAKV
jgi:hypothetical protein